MRNRSGEDRLPMTGVLDGGKTDCWMLVSEDKEGEMTYTETFWISKRTHEFLKEEDSFGGQYRVKVKLPGAMPDLLKKFGPKG